MCKYSFVGNLSFILWFMFFQQWRLIPYLAAAYALEIFTKSIFMNFVEFQIGQVMRDKSVRQVSKYQGHVCGYVMTLHTTVQTMRV